MKRIQSYWRGAEMELLDIVDEKGNPTGETVPREVAHREGIRHHTAHVWIFRRRGGVVQILLQKRSDSKDSDPGCYDISSAGHIPAGSDYIPSAVRELKEELGVDMNGDELIYCGQRRFRFERKFHGSMFCDNQVTNVYGLGLTARRKILYCRRKKCLGSGGWTSRIAYLLSGRTEFPTAFTWKNWNF